MKRSFFFPAILALILVFAACNDKGKAKLKETPASIAQAWCDLNGKYTRAAEGKEKDMAKITRKKYEDEVMEKYKGDTAFAKQIGEEVEKCEAASEGK